MSPKELIFDLSHDFVVLCKTDGDACIVKVLLVDELSQEKTRIVHLEKGFDFKL